MGQVVFVLNRLPGSVVIAGDLTVGGNLFVNGLARNVWLGDLNIQSVTPQVIFTETDASVDNGWWDFAVQGEQFLGRTINDANNVTANWLQVDRTGTVVDSVQLFGQTQVQAGTAATPGLGFAAEAGLGVFRSAAGTMAFSASGSAVAIAFANATNAGRFSVQNNANAADIALSVTDPGVAQRFVVRSSGATEALTLQTADPGAGVAPWRLGTVVAAAAAFDATRYVQVMINGVVVRLGVVT